jgi:soluble lytic murein transglycosylase-like protein
MRRLIPFLFALLLPVAAMARPPEPPRPAPAPDPWLACRQAIAAAEPASGLPPGLLLSIALVETGRAMPGSGRLEPWPWSLNVEGEGRVHASRAAAVADAQALLAAGRRSIDVGCMQVNLLHHPNAFPSVEQGFDPAVNVAYAIRFLRSLQARLGSWEAAIAAYHSSDPERGGAYHRKVAMAQLGAAWTGGGMVLLKPSAALEGLCAPGFRAALKFVKANRRPRLACAKA